MSRSTFTGMQEYRPSGFREQQEKGNMDRYKGDNMQDTMHVTSAVRGTQSQAWQCKDNSSGGRHTTLCNPLRHIP